MTKWASFMIAYVFVASVSAEPSLRVSRPRARHGVVVSREHGLDFYHPPTNYEIFTEGVDHTLSEQGTFSVEAAAVAFVQSRTKFATGFAQYRTWYSNEYFKNVYLQQSHAGIPVANAVANVAFNTEDKVVAFGSSFTNLKGVAPSVPIVSVEAATEIAARFFRGRYNGITRKLEYFAKEDNSAVLTHVIQIRNESSAAWYEAFVDAHTGEVVSFTDFASHATYLALPITKHAPTAGFETISDPADLAVSPLGWHATGDLVNASTTDTSGNNIVAYKGSETTGQSSPNLTFIYPWDSKVEPTTTGNVDAACVNAFYVANAPRSLLPLWFHGGNFQENNFGKGGEASDPVIISVQNDEDTDTAAFWTPPDGQPGLMHIYLWTGNTPQRDGALSNDIIIHEYTHGVTNRMVGGGSTWCLRSTEGQSLGEGFSDAMAGWTKHTSSKVEDVTIAEYVRGAGGIRRFPYSTNSTVNPLRYSNVTLNYDMIHRAGEVWANILHNIYAALVAEHGWSATAHTNSSGTEGNVVFLKLFVQSLGVMPCGPRFIDARDAMILADNNIYAGANKCLLWRQFASRGMGMNAMWFEDDDTIPEECMMTTTTTTRE